MKKIQSLRIAGITFCASPIILTSQIFLDLSKGLLMGAGIGLLMLSLLLQLKKPKTI